MARRYEARLRAWLNANVRHQGRPEYLVGAFVSHVIQSTLFEVRQTTTYENWFAGLRDRVGKARIDIRIHRLSLGNAGDVKPVGEGVSELRIDYGPGFRVSLVQRNGEFIVLLAGGDKASQDRDIREAKELARNL